MQTCGVRTPGIKETLWRGVTSTWHVNRRTVSCLVTRVIRPAGRLKIPYTLCNHPSFEIIRKARGSKIDACRSCIYYKTIMKRRSGNSP